MTHIIAVIGCIITLVLGAIMVIDMIGYGKQTAASGAGCLFMMVVIVVVILWRVSV